MTTCTHPQLTITHIAPCGDAHTPVRVCPDEVVTARCRACPAGFVAVGWPAFDRREWTEFVAPALAGSVAPARAAVLGTQERFETRRTP